MTVPHEVKFEIKFMYFDFKHDSKRGKDLSRWISKPSVCPFARKWESRVSRLSSINPEYLVYVEAEIQILLMNVGWRVFYETIGGRELH